MATTSDTWEDSILTRDCELRSESRTLPEQESPEQLDHWSEREKRNSRKYHTCTRSKHGQQAVGKELKRVEQKKLLSTWNIEYNL